jgi:hypothetical protein
MTDPTQPVTNTYHLNDGTEFTLTATEKALTQLAPAILSDLGCTYEIRWPIKTYKDLEERQEDTRARRRYAKARAEIYAASRALPGAAYKVDNLAEMLETAWMAGYEAAPKGVNSK